MPGESFPRWLAEVTPGYRWDWPHLARICEALERITAGDSDRLMIFMPPRHGKSELATVRYPVFRLERDPELRVILGAHSQRLANRFSRRSRRIARERLELSRERAAVDDWETSAGGGVRAVGVGGGITGQGGGLILVDDPVRSRAEAESVACRERVWEWFTDDLYTRLEPRGALVLIQTRWHEDDLAGRILASEEGGGWEVLRLPALAETQAERDDWQRAAGRPGGLPDPVGREPGEPLCPERFDARALERIRSVLGLSFQALYQQRPTEPEGSFFRREWLPVVAAGPEEALRVRYWDKAATADGGAYTAGVLMARCAAGFYFVEDVVRGRWSSGERDRVIRRTAEADAARHAGAVRIWIEQEPGSGGKESAESSVRGLAGFPARCERVTGDKRVRAEPLAAQAEAGNVRLVRGPWNAAYLDELVSFPAGRYADQVDASSGAFNKLAAGKRKIRVY